MIFNLFESRATKLDGMHPSDDAPLSAWSGAASYSGVDVSPANSQTFLAFGAVVRFIAGLVGRTPLKLYQRTDEGRRTVRDDPRYLLMHDEPNPETTSVVFREALQGHACTWGNAYAEVAFRGGDVEALWQLRPDLMEVRRTKRSAGARELLWYIYDGSTWLTPQEVVHVPWFTGAGYVGLSPVELHREDIGLGVAAREMMAAFHGQGGWPGVIFERPDGAPSLTKDGEEMFLERFADRFQGPRKSFRAAVTQEGTKATVLNIPFKDAQHLERTRLSIEDMARIFLVPSFVLGEDKDGQSYNSLEIKHRAVLDYGIMIWLVRWEQELNRKLLTKAERADGYYFEYDVGGFLRGDSKTQAEVHDTYARAGILAPNEAREHLNMPKVEGGDTPWIELNRQPLNQAASQTQAERALRAALELPIEHRATDNGQDARAQRSLSARYRLRQAFFGIIEQSAGRVVTAEVKAVKRELDKLPATGRESFLNWLKRFFESHSEFAASVMGPPLFSYLEAVAREIAEELERPFDEFAAVVEKFSADYRDAFAKRQGTAGYNTMKKIIRESGTDDELREAMLERLDGWAETGAERIAKRESTQGMGGISVAVYGFAGIARLVWDWPGGKCGICPQFHGRTVQVNRPFASPGETITTPDDSSDYIVESIISHPPAHGGCQCGVRPA